MASGPSGSFRQLKDFWRLKRSGLSGEVWDWLSGVSKRRAGEVRGARCKKFGVKELNFV